MWRVGGRHPLPLVRAAPRSGHADPPILDSFIEREGDEDLDLFGHHDVVLHQHSRATALATSGHRIHRRVRRRMSRHQGLPRPRLF